LVRRAVDLIDPVVDARVTRWCLKPYVRVRALVTSSASAGNTLANRAICTSSGPGSPNRFRPQLG
jgi:hypothetical protein